MKHKGEYMTDNIKISLIIGTSIIIATSFGSIVNSYNKKVDREFKLEQETSNRRRYNLCVEEAFTNYNNAWTSSCGNLGANCSLRVAQANAYNKILEQDKSNCVKLYSN